MYIYCQETFEASAMAVDTKVIFSCIDTVLQERKKVNDDSFGYTNDH